MKSTDLPMNSTLARVGLFVLSILIMFGSVAGPSGASTRIVYLISGTVNWGGVGLEGVTMAGLPGSPVTDASGAYSAPVEPGFGGTVTPTLANYTFDPMSLVYTDVTADMPGQDYEATLIQTQQRQALIAFYNATGGDGWTYMTGWKDGDLYPDGFALPGTEAGWYGLTGDSGAQQVTPIGRTTT